jgi:hypothetical protein
MMTVEKEEKKGEKGEKKPEPATGEEMKLDLLFENIERVFHGLLVMDKSVGCLTRMVKSV